LTDDTAHDTTATPATPVRGEPWFLGAFLVLFGIAVSSAMPQISLAVQAAVANASKPAQASRDAASRPTAGGVVIVDHRALAGPGAVDLPSPVAAASATGAEAQVFVLDLAQFVRQRVVNARAPPASNA
jgi:hypothetical protein